jgi:hypothetical protein
MAGSFGHLITAEASGDRPAGAGRLVHLHENRAAVVQVELDQSSHSLSPPRCRLAATPSSAWSVRCWPSRTTNGPNPAAIWDWKSSPPATKLSSPVWERMALVRLD